MRRRAIMRWPALAVWLGLAGLAGNLLLEVSLGPASYAGGDADPSAAKPPEANDKTQMPSGDGGDVDSANHPPESVSSVSIGPALDVPKEVLNMLDQRKRHLDQREEVLRAEQNRLGDLKRDLEELLDRYEATAKAFEAKQQQARESATTKAEKANKQQGTATGESHTPLDTVTKIYEAMPSEEAAVRIEKMPSDMAVKVLRSLKSKTAGAILAQVRPDKAAKLTVELFGSPSKQSKKLPARPSPKK